MGKGDMKTKRGKRIRGSYGKTRPKQQQSVVKQTKEHLVHEHLMEEKKEAPKAVKKEKETKKATKEKTGKEK
ncbi:MAG: 30S ribosomal protein THX [Clostridia bacterium]|nr:30S ribosomal protein THX [Clostridia bacterium]